MSDQGCTCQSCGRKYRVDIVTPDDLWAAIRLDGKPEDGGLLCGPCIAERIEQRAQYSGRFRAYFLTDKECNK